MKRLAFTALVVGSASASQAVIWIYTSALNGFQQVPQVPTPGIGTVVLQLDDVNHTLAGNGTVQFLTSAVTDFHLHQAAFGANGPVIVPIGASGVSGNTVNFNVPVSNFTAVKAAMDSLNTYLNIHTVNFPSGEIRGQVYPVPEPATLAALGLGAVALLRRRRK